MKDITPKYIVFVLSCMQAGMHSTVAWRKAKPECPDFMTSTLSFGNWTKWLHPKDLDWAINIGRFKTALRMVQIYNLSLAISMCRLLFHRSSKFTDQSLLLVKID